MLLTYNDTLSRYEFLCTYHERMVAKDANFLWDKDTRRWFTTDPVCAIKLIEYSDKSTLEKLRSIDREIRAIVDASMATTSSLIVPSREGMEYMSYQIACIEYCIGRERVLIGDQQGLGKTIEAIGLINYTNPDSILIVCPASLKINWYKELLRWLVEDYTIEMVKSNVPIWGSDIAIVNYDILGGKVAGKVVTRDDLLRKYDMIVVDECHYVKNGKAIRTKALRNIINIQNHTSRIIMMSGTPFVNKPIELFPILQMLKSSLASNWATYTKRYCGAYRDKWGWKTSGASNLDELQSKLRSTIMIRRVKDDVLTELPPKRIQVISLEGDSANEEEWWNEYEDRKAKLMAEVEIAKTISKDAYNEAIRKLRYETKVAFSEMSKIRHDSALRKLDKCIEYIDDLMESVDKILVFFHHQDVMKILYDRLSKYGVVKLDGTDSPEEKDESVVRLQTDPNTRVFLGSIRAAGTGLTLTAAYNLIFVEFDWAPGIMDQCIDRSHRYGQMHPVLAQYLMVDGTIDSKMLQISNEKQTIFDQVMNDDFTVSEIEIPDSIEMKGVDQSYIRTGLLEIDLDSIPLQTKYIVESLLGRDYMTDKQLDLAKRIVEEYHD